MSEPQRAQQGDRRPQGSETDELRQLRRGLDGEDERDALRALLQPGEALRETGSANVAHGDTGSPEDWEPLELRTPRGLDRLWDFATRTAVRKLVFFTVLSPLMLVAAVDSLGASISGWLDRLVGGVVCSGPRASHARRVAHALSPLGLRADRLLVSDRRLALVRRAGSWRDNRPEIAHSVPLAQIAEARRRPRGVLRRRVEIVFVDASRIVLALPSFQSPPPARVVAALTTPPGVATPAPRRLR